MPVAYYGTDFISYSAQAEYFIIRKDYFIFAVRQIFHSMCYYNSAVSHNIKTPFAKCAKGVFCRIHNTTYAVLLTIP